MLKDGVIINVTNVEKAQIAKETDAVSVMVSDKLLYEDVKKLSTIRQQ